MDKDLLKTKFESFKDRFSKVAGRVRQVLAILSIIATIVVVCLYPVPLWTGIAFAVVTLLAFVFTLMWRDIWVHTIYSFLAFAACWWIMSFEPHEWSFFLGALGWCVLYYIMPVVLKAITPRLEHDTHTNSSAWFFAFVFFVIGSVNLFYHDQQEKERLYEKEAFMPITRWEVEVHDGETYYILFTKRGYIAVNPQDYPEVRYVNKNTEVRYLQQPHSVNSYYSHMLEIKNN